MSDGGDPEVVIVAERQSPEVRTLCLSSYFTEVFVLQVYESVIFHINGLTGEEVTATSGKGVRVFSGPLTSAFLLDQGSKFIALLDQSLKVSHHYKPL